MGQPVAGGRGVACWNGHVDLVTGVLNGFAEWSPAGEQRALLYLIV